MPGLSAAPVGPPPEAPSLKCNNVVFPGIQETIPYDIPLVVFRVSVNPTLFATFYSVFEGFVCVLSRRYSLADGIP